MTELDSAFGSRMNLQKRPESAIEGTKQSIELDEFLAQVQFKRTSQIEGYSETKIAFTYVPYKLSSVN